MTIKRMWYSLFALCIIIGALYFIIYTPFFKPSVGSRMARCVVENYLAEKFSDKATARDAREALITLSKLAVLPGGTEVRDVKICSMDSKWVIAKNAERDKGRAVLYFHGGGFFCGSPETHMDLIARISKASGLPVLAPDYRLAPEHKFPAANEDCLFSYEWLLKQGYKPENIVIGGDSAGGCLTLMTLLSIKEKGLEMPGGAFFISPLTDAVHFNGESMTARAGRDPWFTAEDIGSTISRYTGDLKEKPPILSPVNMDLSGLPPLLIQVGSEELLFSDSDRLAKRAKEKGVKVKLEVYDHMWHVFQTFAVVVPEAGNAIKSIGAFIKESVSGAEEKTEKS